MTCAGFGVLAAAAAVASVYCDVDSLMPFCHVMLTTLTILLLFFSFHSILQPKQSICRSFCLLSN